MAKEDVKLLVEKQAGRCYRKPATAAQAWQLAVFSREIESGLNYTIYNTVPICLAFNTAADTAAHKDIAADAMVEQGARWTRERSLSNGALLCWLHRMKLCTGKTQM